MHTKSSDLRYFLFRKNILLSGKPFNNMKYIIFCIFCVALVGFTNAQNKSPQKLTITGKIIDKSTNKPLEFASIYFENINKKTNLGTTSDKRGKFMLEIPKGHYKMTISFLSYKSFIVTNKVINKNENIGIISLSYSAATLKEVSLNYEKGLMEFTNEKKIYNVSKDIANSGGTALTVLDNAPYVSVDGNNNVSIRNNSNIQILINGKPSGIVDGDMSNLSAIPANSILKVEVITSKSAKYDAEGSGGILNIILKKGKGLGLNTSIETHVGTPDDDGISANINYKTKSVSFFSTTGYNHSSNPEHQSIEQQFLNTNLITTGFFNEKDRTTKQANAFLTNFGADFYLDKSTTITTSLLIKTRDKNYNTASTLNDFDASNNPTKTAKRSEINGNNVNRYEYLLSINKNFNKKGENISIDVKYNYAKANALGNIIETTSFPATDPIKNQKSTKDQSLNTYLSQIDYTLPLGKNSKLETGIKSATRIYKNKYNVSQLDLVTNKFLTIGNFDDKVRYDETIKAGYIQISSNNNFSYSFGLRIENTKINIELTNNPGSTNKNYTNLFPSASLSYNFKDNSVLTMSYSRSVDRPSIGNVNPFISFSNERFQTIGNPNLNPYYTDFVEIDYHKRLKKIAFTNSIYYSLSKDLLTYIIEDTGKLTSDGFKIFNRFPINNGNFSSIGTDLDLTYRPIKNVRLKAYSTIYTSDITKTLNGNYDINDVRWYTQMSSLIKFKNGLKFQIKYDYQSTFKMGQIKLKPQQYTSIAFSKEILNNNATLTFRVNDIFETRTSDLLSTEANAPSEQVIRYNNRQFLLSFTYRIKQKKRRNKHNRIYDIDSDDFK